MIRRTSCGLIGAGRRPNGYRDDDACVDRVLQIRGLLGAGPPTRVITQVLPCLDTGAVHVRDATPETIATLERELDRMTARIGCLTRNRDAVAGYLDAVRRAGCPSPPSPARPPLPTATADRDPVRTEQAVAR